MLIDNLATFVAIILAISLAAERLVTIIKTLIPSLADEAKTEAQEVDIEKDKWRRLTVQLLAFVFSWLTSTFLADGVTDSATYFSNLFLGKVKIGEAEVPVLILGLLASGGSAFWTNILGYTKAVKDIRIQERANASLQFHIMASAIGQTPIDGGQVVGASGKLGNATKRAESIRTALDTQSDRAATAQSIADLNK